MSALPEAPARAPGSVAALRARFRDGKAAIVGHFRSSRPTSTAARQLLKALARHVDATLADLWTHAGMPPGAALVAVGGYGRGELFPCSDIDVLVLLPADAAGGDALRAAVEGFITACWDIGLEIGSSVRTLDECLQEARRDVTVQTALLESRLICGARKLYNGLRDATTQAVDAPAFLRAKTLEMQQRHVKYEGTPYSLEPNCKESPGGLRDLQVVIWVARAAGLGRTWGELAAKGLVTPFEASQLARHEGTLKLIRARLHVVAGRREDRLVFDLQTAVAESFGYHPTKGQRSSEVLMHRYYWAAKAVAQLNQILMMNIEERVNGSEAAPGRPISERFLDRAGMLEVARDDLYLEHPDAILETFLVFAQEPGIQGLSSRTLRALYNSRSVMDGRFRRDPRNRALFMQILRQPTGLTHAFRLLNSTSVLGRYLWVFRRIVGRMQHDLFHVYTVDQHILMVLRNVRRFFIPEHAHEYPFCSRLAAHWDHPELLYVAALFHDVAKGRGGDHSELGAVEVRRFCRDHGLSRADTQLVEFLVRHHLTMSRIAQKEDLSDSEVIASFARLVGNERQLIGLYLLTVADIRGTSPRVWNAWKGKLLEDLFRLTLRALGGSHPNIDAEIEARMHEARQILALHTALPGTEEPLWRTLEVSYFARHEAADIAWHARSLWRHIETREPVVRARPSSVGDGLQVLVYSPDRQDLFARICGYFDGAGFSILDAKIHTTRAGYALDTFQVVSTRLADTSPAAYRDLIALVETQATAALASDGPLPQPSQGRVSRRVRSFPVVPRVTLAPDERAQRWLLTVTASDRSGLLYAIARVLGRHHINLQLAKITTLGERVEDTFLVDGPALQQPRTQLQIESELLDAVAAPA
ncbi:[protein-PII] uridylyltransferase [Rubrivivax gelatinosus]|uniref:Bifunctional uridylyltransferase/uridylyl-removing enzyme n=1 Tax=Rubrivivax gelatinosus TaxID=28068 RepID=A0A4R2MMJ6_RUBGE|nr:[protein-PII] uridylyltransferase [Rubrivivax gelatinosus]MBK1689756.1 [protein-PII] uridylyltransferase [Rubrivivax gelatinosus]TCP04256.1 UTP--GlnB (protein PII) uridylyltransferase GlnD [Rubrivivax gelatinosus]